MHPWLLRLWRDEAVFVRSFCALTTGYGVAASTNALPTGIAGAQKYAWLITALGAFIAAGSSTRRRSGRRRKGGRFMGKGTKRIATAMLLLGTLLVARTAGAAAGWIMTSCAYSHSAPDDPIVYPGQAGASHLHDFIGNGTTVATSTYASMLRGATTCAAASGDTAGYWFPALTRNGVGIKPDTKVSIYYRKDNLADGTLVEVPPADLRVRSGAPLREVYWGCSDNATGKLGVPPARCASGSISAHVGFPNCWSGRLTHRDDTAELAYPVKGKCPATFPHPLARVIVRFTWKTGVDVGAIRLSSGGPETLHGDFWNTWDQTKLADLVARCLNANVDCGKR